MSKKNLKRSSDEFDFSKSRTQNDSSKQGRVLCNSFHRLEPMVPVQAVQEKVDFELKDSYNLWNMGENTYFEIKGQFQSRTPEDLTKYPPTPASAWEGVRAQDSANVIVCPNFWDMLIKKTEALNGEQWVQSSDEGMFPSFGYLNAWKYNFMDADQKKKLCQQACHPGLGVPSKKGDWTFGVDSEWQAYSKHIFLGPDKSVTFDWVPLDFFPFFQGTNYLDGKQLPLPLPVLDNTFRVRFSFVDFKNTIFKKKDGNEKEYRFALQNFTLCYEKLSLNSAYQKTLLAEKKFNFSGVTRILRPVNVKASETSWPVEISNVQFPEGLFAFALPRSVLSGNFPYQDRPTNDVFLPHNIARVNFTYGGEKFFVETPDIGTIGDSQMQRKLLSDLRERPPFGLSIDKNKISRQTVADGWSDTPFPCVYLSFCTDKEKSRLVPVLERGPEAVKIKKTQSPGCLNLTFVFNNAGAAQDAVYMVYVFFTDSYISLDCSKKSSQFFCSDYM